MKFIHWLLAALTLSILANASYGAWPWSDEFDLPALAKKARPATLQLIVFDSAGDQIATGTGFVISAEGIVVTNGHVIKNATKLIAKSENGQTFPVVGVLDEDATNDVVLLKIKAEKLSSLPLGNTSKVTVGEHVAVIGSPLGLEGTVSDGIVSALRKGNGGLNWIQITAAISPGSSGSPVLDTRGSVVGVATMLIRGGQSLNFAVPVEAVNALSRTGKLSSIEDVANVLRNYDALDDPSYKSFKKALDTSNWEAISVSLSEILGRHPDWSDGYSQLIFPLHKLGRNQDALAAGQRALALNPNDPQAWEMIGFVLRELGNRADSIAAYKKAARLNSNSDEAWGNLFDLYLEIGDKAAASVAIGQLKRIMKSKNNIRKFP